MTNNEFYNQVKLVVDNNMITWEEAYQQLRALLEKFVVAPRVKPTPPPNQVFKEGFGGSMVEVKPAQPHDPFRDTVAPDHLLPQDCAIEVCSKKDFANWCKPQRDCWVCSFKECSQRGMNRKVHCAFYE